MIEEGLYKIKKATLTLDNEDFGKWIHVNIVKGEQYYVMRFEPTAIGNHKDISIMSISKTSIRTRMNKGTLVKLRMEPFRRVVRHGLNYPEKAYKTLTRIS